MLTATNHNGSLMMNASAVIIDDEPLAANYNNLSSHLSVVIDVVCLSEFLSSFPDVNQIELAIIAVHIHCFF